MKIFDDWRVFIAWTKHACEMSESRACWKVESPTYLIINVVIAFALVRALSPYILIGDGELITRSVNLGAVGDQLWFIRWNKSAGRVLSTEMQQDRSGMNLWSKKSLFFSITKVLAIYIHLRQTLIGRSAAGSSRSCCNRRFISSIWSIWCMAAEWPVIAIYSCLWTMHQWPMDMVSHSVVQLPRPWSSRMWKERKWLDERFRWYTPPDRAECAICRTNVLLQNRL